MKLFRKKKMARGKGLFCSPAKGVVVKREENANVGSGNRANE